MRSDLLLDDWEAIEHFCTRRGGHIDEDGLSIGRDEVAAEA
jgi:hypothetical protein